MLVGIDASFAGVYCQVVQVCGVTGYSSCWCLDYELYLDYYPLYGLVVVVFVVVVVALAGCAFVANRYAVQEASFSFLHPVKPTPPQQQQHHHHETNNCLPSLILIRSHRRFHHGEDVGGEHPRLYHPNHNHHRQSQIHSRE